VHEAKATGTVSMAPMLAATRSMVLVAPMPMAALLSLRLRALFEVTRSSFFLKGGEDGQHEGPLLRY
jgi:hypothetical protein